MRTTSLRDIEQYRGCLEAEACAAAAREAEARAGGAYPLPDYWADVAKRAWMGADVALKAHHLGKCTCQIREANKATH